MPYTYTYTTRDEIETLLSQTGSDQWLNDLGDDSTYFIEVIDDATGTMNQYLQRLHDPVDLYQSPWVRRRATYLACYFLTTRRGDPGVYGEHYQRIMDELELVVEGVIQVPDIAFSAGMQAVMQNVTVDQRFIYSKSRVRSSISTDTGGREPISYTIPYEWMYY